MHLLFIIAPGSYEIEKAEKRVHESSSAYSFGIKYKEQKFDDIPGKTFVSILIYMIHLNILILF